MACESEGHVTSRGVSRDRYQNYNADCNLFHPRLPFFHTSWSQYMIQQLLKVRVLTEHAVEFSVQLAL